MVVLPNEYQEVEYLESTGTQYIITNYHPQTDWTAVDWIFAFTANQDGDQMLWGARSATNGKKVWQCEKYAGRSWYVACGSVSYRGVLNAYGGGLNAYGGLNQIYTGHVDNTTFIIAGGSASPTQTNTGENESAMGIFCWNKNGTAEYKNNGLRIYSLTFKENNIVSANFIPCYRKSDNEPGMYDLVSDTFYTNSGTGTFLKGYDVNRDMPSLLDIRRHILLNTPHTELLTGNSVTFNTDMKAPLKECKVYFTPVQEGEGTPTPENVRPIHGWDGITVMHAGDNLYTYNPDNKGYISAAGKISKDTVSTYSDLIPVNVGDKFVYHCISEENASTQTTRRMHGYNASGTWVKQITSEAVPARVPSRPVDLEFTIPSGISFIRISIRIKDTETYVKKVTPYEIQFPQTIYGGYVDLVNGEIVEEWAGVVIDAVGSPCRGISINSNSNTSASWFLSHRFGAPRAVPYEARSTDGYCSHVRYYVNNYYYDPKAQTANDIVQLVLPGEMTSAEYDAWLIENPVTVCYRRNTPASYPIDSQVIKTLKGVNEIWSDANGNVEIKYWTHKQGDRQ